MFECPKVSHVIPVKTIMQGCFSWATHLGVKSATTDNVGSMKILPINGH